MSRSPSTTTGRITMVLSIVAILGLVFITLFYTISAGTSGPFGTLNDISVALGALLSGVLAGRLYLIHRTYAPRLSRVALAIAIVGAILATLGSSFAIFDITGWFLAGLITTFGYSLLGVWLLIVSSSARGWRAFPHRLALFGIVVSSVMIIGILSGPGILARIDAMDSAPWFVLTALYVGGLGWNVLYTFWCIFLSLRLLSGKLILQASTELSEV